MEKAVLNRCVLSCDWIIPYPCSRSGCGSERSSVTDQIQLSTISSTLAILLLDITYRSSCSTCCWAAGKNLLFGSSTACKEYVDGAEMPKCRKVAFCMILENGPRSGEEKSSQKVTLPKISSSSPIMLLYWPLALTGEIWQASGRMSEGKRRIMVSLCTLCRVLV